MSFVLRPSEVLRYTSPSFKLPRPRGKRFGQGVSVRVSGVLDLVIGPMGGVSVGWWSAVLVGPLTSCESEGARVHPGDADVYVGHVQVGAMLPLRPRIELPTVAIGNGRVRKERVSPATATELILCGLREGA